PSPLPDAHLIGRLLFFKRASRRASCKERLFLDRTLRLYLIIMKFFCRFFSLFVELENGLTLVFFFTNSFRSVFPACGRRRSSFPPFPDDVFHTSPIHSYRRPPHPLDRKAVAGRERARQLWRTVLPRAPRTALRG
uniref:Uncharacterized protein n=1 Tax=Ornithorhynchus anatinus TaxID=9258 RepID=A0A6I8MYF0_ORNAN